MNREELKERIKDDLEELWRYIQILWYVPKACMYCEVMGLCRTRKHYRCGRRGCLLLYWKEQDERERKEKEKEG